MSQPPVVVVQPLQEPLFSFPESGGVTSPRVNEFVSLGIIEPIVRTAVKRNEQQCPGLLGLDQRKDAPDRAAETLIRLGLAENGISRKQQRIEFTTHYVAVHLQVTIQTQCFAGQSPVLVSHPLRTMLASQSLVQPRIAGVVVQPTI